MSDKADRIARAIKDAHDAGERFKNLTGDNGPADEAEAYAAQWRFHRLNAAEGRGPLGGRKIALASQVQQELCGIDRPIAGGVFASEIHPSPARILLSDYHGLGIEFELAFKLANKLVAGSGPYDSQSIRRHIASVHAALELIIDRGADYSNIDALTMIADNAWSAGIILGPEIPDWSTLDVNDLPVALHWNDDAPVSAVTGLSDPLGSLSWMVTLLTGQGQTVEAGEIVITGSVIRTRYPVGGERIRYDVAQKSSVSLTID